MFWDASPRTEPSDGWESLHQHLRAGLLVHALLRFIEQKEHADAIDAYVNNRVAYTYDATYNTYVVASFVCPTDPTSPKTVTVAGTKQGFHGNYVLCAGSTVFNPSTSTDGSDLNGMFYTYSQTTLAQLVDGTSNTLMGSEIIVSPDTTTHDNRGRYYNAWQGHSLFSRALRSQHQGG